MRIFVATGIYPPEIGGPAFYAKNLTDALVRKGHNVRVVQYGWVKRLPTGLRHFVYFLKFFWHSVINRPDNIIALDTYSVGLPVICVSKVLQIPVTLRVGGDFLWEMYVERTGERVQLVSFYEHERALTRKEKIIFSLTKWTLRHAHRIVFSTSYQRDIFFRAYGCDANKCSVVENFYGPKQSSETPTSKTFISFSRSLTLKNIPVLEGAFAAAKKKCPEIRLETGSVSQEQLFEKIRTCYAVVVPSFSEVSPNIVLEGIQHNKPFILTKDTGLRKQLDGLGVFIDPFDVGEITNALCSLARDDIYQGYIEKVKRFNVVHTYDDIAREFMTLV